MRRHILALGAGALCLALAPTLALGSQSNDAAASAVGNSANTVVQDLTTPGGGAQSASATQVLPIAVAPAVNAQVVPVNANVPIRVASPGGDGPVRQTNSSEAEAAAVNSNAIAQRSGGHHKPGGGAQSASATQVLPIAVAPAVNAQVVPVNANVPIRVASPGGDGPVRQTNSSEAEAAAVNSNAIAQRSGGHHKPGGGAQSASATQVLPIAVAPAVNAQVVPVNANVPVTLGLPPLPIDPFAVLADPVGTVTGVVGDPVGAVTGLVGALPIDPFAVLADPVGTVTGVVGDPVGAVTGLLGGLPLPIGL